MFRFLTSKASDPREPLQTQKTAAAWFRQLPSTDVIGRALQVIAALDAAGRSGKGVDLARVAAIEYVDAELGADRGQLITQYVDHADGSPAVAERIWNTAYGMAQGFIAVYRHALDAALAESGDARLKQIVPRLIARLIHFYGTDAKLRTLRLEGWIPAKWIELHQLYRQAIELGIERAPFAPDVAGKAAARRTIEQEYIAVLLTHLLNTGMLTPAEIDWAGAQVRAWSRRLELDAVPRVENGFAVDIRGRKGLVRRAQGDVGKTLRYLDTQPLTEQLDRAVVELGLPGAAQAEAAGPINGQRIAMLHRLRPVFAPEFVPARTREPRAVASYVAEVCTGIARICETLAPGDMLDVPIEGGDPAAPSPADAPAHRMAPRMRTQAPAGSDSSEWRVQNRSASGMNISATGGNRHALLLGTLVAVRPAGGGDWSLGVVRRLTRAASDRVEAGVAVIARRFTAVALHGKRQARDDMGFVVDGIDLSTMGERFDGIYLQRPPDTVEAKAAQTLVIPTAEYAEGRNVTLITGHTVYTVALRAPIERCADWTWVEIEVVDRTMRG